ncbi:hypothetical protein F5Y19DRAFT_435609 [Xylariaceae sp. FL1651]|nr:hypothetical protein F5Y19DRAFT_435609 [Xylariaceae sp. FL1651]
MSSQPLSSMTGSSTSAPPLGYGSGSDSLASTSTAEAVTATLSDVTSSRNTWYPSSLTHSFGTSTGTRVSYTYSGNGWDTSTTSSTTFGLSSTPAVPWCSMCPTPSTVTITVIRTSSTTLSEDESTASCTLESTSTVDAVSITPEPSTHPAVPTTSTTSNDDEIGTGILTVSVPSSLVDETLLTAISNTSTISNCSTTPPTAQNTMTLTVTAWNASTKSLTAASTADPASASLSGVAPTSLPTPCEGEAALAMQYAYPTRPPASQRTWTWTRTGTGPWPFPTSHFNGTWGTWTQKPTHKPSDKNQLPTTGVAVVTIRTLRTAPPSTLRKVKRGH